MLLAHGHVDAYRYPLPVLWRETKIVRRRVNRDHVTQALLTQTAIASVFGGKEFQKLIKTLSEDT